MFKPTTLPQGYHIKTLTVADLPNVLAMQEVIIASLPENEKNFIIAKSAEKIEARITQLGEMMGVFAETGTSEKLVAYNGVVFPNQAWPVGDMVLQPQALPCAPQQLAVVQSCSVHPEHRGKHLHKLLIAAQEEVCFKQGKTHFMAEVAAMNIASLKGFLDRKYHVVHAGFDPDDGCKLLYTYKAPKSPLALFHNAKIIFVNPMNEFETMQGHLADGYRGMQVSSNRSRHDYTLHLATPVFA